MNIMLLWLKNASRVDSQVLILLNDLKTIDHVRKIH